VSVCSFLLRSSCRRLYVMMNAVIPAEVKTADTTLIAIPAFTLWLSPVEGEPGSRGAVEVRVLDAEGNGVVDDDDDGDGDGDGDDGGSDDDDDDDDDNDNDNDDDDGDNDGDTVGEAIGDAVEVVCSIPDKYTPSVGIVFPSLA
ncbi:MAG: hypothetical protein Q9214_000458, partial [Letrouitia sp. 1 TL-2023]